MSNEIKAVNKKCKKCKQLLPVAFFSKKSSSDDGLQEWCKFCQKENSKTNRELHKKRKHTNNLNLLSYYHRKYGLEYNFLESKKKLGFRKYISYKCLNCGVEVKSTIKTAIKNKFVCCNCNKVNFEQKEQIQEQNQNCENYCNDCNTCNTKQKQEYTPKGMVFDNLDEVLRVLRAKEQPEDISNLKHVKVIIIEKPVIQNIPVTNTLVKEKKGFFTWLKNLFKPRK